MMGEFLKKPKIEQRFFHFFPTGFLYMNMQSKVLYTSLLELFIINKETTRYVKRPKHTIKTKTWLKFA